MTGDRAGRRRPATLRHRMNELATDRRNVVCDNVEFAEDGYELPGIESRVSHHTFHMQEGRLQVTNVRRPDR